MLVHGAWHGSWTWDRLITEPALGRFRIDAVDLPGVARGSPPDDPRHHDLAAHAEWLRHHAEQIDGPIVVCAHSYGGAVIGQALAGLPNVRAAVFVAAFMLEVGESCRDANTSSGDRTIGPELRGDYLVVAPEVATAMFYQDAEPDLAASAAAKVTPEHLGTVSAPVCAAAWHDVPTTYVLTERDRALPLAAQRVMAARSDVQVRMDTGHSPMLTVPDRFAAVLCDAVPADLRA